MKSGSVKLDMRPAVVQHGDRKKWKIGDTINTGSSPQASTIRFKLLTGCSRDRSVATTRSPAAWNPPPLIQAFSSAGTCFRHLRQTWRSCPEQRWWLVYQQEELQAGSVAPEEGSPQTPWRLSTPQLWSCMSRLQAWRWMRPACWCLSRR